MSYQLFLSLIYREFCKARLAEMRKHQLAGTEHAEGESQRRILHGRTNGTRDLGDDGSAEDTFETGRQTSVRRAAVSP
jgi:hypothetical protein